MSDGTLPLFPLGTVLVPGQALPLHVFEPRYRRLVADLMAAEEDPVIGRAFGVIAIREGHEVGVGAARALHTVGTTARIASVHRYDDGRYDVMTVGDRRFRLDSLADDRPYATGAVTWLDEAPGVGPESASPIVRSLLIDYREGLVDAQLLDEADPDDLPTDPRDLSYTVATAMILDRVDRQRILECPDDTERLALGLRLLRRESALAQVVASVPAADLARTETSLN